MSVSPAAAGPVMLRRTRRDWLLLFAGWSALAVLQALVGSATARTVADWMVLLGVVHLPMAWFWALATPVIGDWSQRIRRYPAAVRLCLHVPTLALAAMAITWLRRALLLLAGFQVGVPYAVTLLYYLDMTIAAYLAAFWAARALQARRQMLERDRHAHALQSRLTAARLDYLEMQLRPHFLFNALSAVAELGHEAPDAAARMLRNVRALLHSATRRADSQTVPLSVELQELAPYIEIQRIRFAGWLELEESVHPAAAQALVPRFILQPLVENAVHHGLAKRERSGRITIAAEVSADRLHIRVMDSGEGLKHASYRESRGLGLRNVRERIHAVYGADARVDLQHDATGATTALLDLPLQHAPAPRPAGAEDGDTSADDAPVLGGRLPELFAQRPWRAVTLAWAVVGVLRFHHSFAYLAFRGRLGSESLLMAAWTDAAVAAIWLLLTMPTVWLARRLADRGAAAILAHCVAGFVIALGHAALVRLVSGSGQPPITSTGYAQLYAWNVATYVTIVGLVHLSRIERWIRERDLAASRLRLELQEARLQKVKLDLRPAVLLQTLGRVEEVISRDARRAEQILSRLGDFLRLTLDSIYEPVITVRQECDRLAAYARVLSDAVTPGLEVDIACATDAMNDPVPNGVLRAALDSILGDGGGPDTSVRIRLDHADGGMLVTVTATPLSVVQGSSVVDREEPLMSYVREGVVQLIASGSDSIQIATTVQPA